MGLRRLLTRSAGQGSLPGLSGGTLDGDAGGVRTSSTDAAFSASSAEVSPASVVASSSSRTASRRAQVHGGLFTEVGDAAASTQRASSADSSAFLFLRSQKFRSIKIQIKTQNETKGITTEILLTLRYDER